MKLEHVLAVLLAAALVVVAFALRGQKQVSRPAKPEDTVAAFFDAATGGDVETYLGLTAGALRRSLDRTRAELGDKRFRANIMKTVAEVKGQALMPGAGAPEGFAALDMEFVFGDRKELQRLLLQNTDTGWAIVEMSEAQTVKPIIPYGTPVFEEPAAKEPQQ